MGERHFFSGKVVMWKMRAGTKFFTITFTRLVHLCFHLQGDLCCISRQNTEQSFLSVVAGQVVSSLTISTYSFSLLSLQIYHCPQDLHLYVSLSLFHKPQYHTSDHTNSVYLASAASYKVELLSSWSLE